MKHGNSQACHDISFQMIHSLENEYSPPSMLYARSDYGNGREWRELRGEQASLVICRAFRTMMLYRRTACSELRSCSGIRESAVRDGSASKEDDAGDAAQVLLFLKNAGTQSKEQEQEQEHDSFDSKDTDCPSSPTVHPTASQKVFVSPQEEHAPHSPVVSLVTTRDTAPITPSSSWSDDDDTDTASPTKKRRLNPTKTTPLYSPRYTSKQKQGVPSSAINQYDVLCSTSPPSILTSFSKSLSHHMGNFSFLTLVKMFRSNFLSRRSNRVARVSIVQKLMNSVIRNSDPDCSGRFLYWKEHEEDGLWYEMKEEMVWNMIMDTILLPETKTSSSSSPRQSYSNLKRRRTHHFQEEGESRISLQPRVMSAPPTPPPPPRSDFRDWVPKWNESPKSSSYPTYTTSIPVSPSTPSYNTQRFVSSPGCPSLISASSSYEEDDSQQHWGDRHGHYYGGGYHGDHSLYSYAR
mmetsp:Transcript_35291/g.51747  ORF Transcript_35291/g.51747 Transcript_35291/m.51747 type:complete len:465 (+) Transcript_35291:231-1625(+)